VSLFCDWFLLLFCGRLVQELFGYFRDLCGDRGFLQVVELLAEFVYWYDCFGYCAMVVGVVDVGEPVFHEFVGVVRIVKVVDADDECAVQDVCDDCSFHVFELQEEVSGVGDEVFAWCFVNEGVEDLFFYDVVLVRMRDIVEPFECDFRFFYLSNECCVG